MTTPAKQPAVASDAEIFKDSDVEAAAGGDNGDTDDNDASENDDADMAFETGKDVAMKGATAALPELPTGCTTLLDYADWAMRRIPGIIPKLGDIAKHGDIRLGSFCSGLCTEKLVATTVAAVADAHGQTVHFSHPFAAEIDRRKRGLILQNHPEINHVAPSVFGDGVRETTW